MILLIKCLFMLCYMFYVYTFAIFKYEYFNYFQIMSVRIFDAKMLVRQWPNSCTDNFFNWNVRKTRNIFKCKFVEFL